jgi:hypothetical protein
MILLKTEVMFILASIPFIAIADYLIFSRWTQCENCGYKGTRWYNWLIPTILEFFFLLAGYALGVAK